MLIDEAAGKVFMTGTDNNIFGVNPKTGREFRRFKTEEFPFFSDLLKKEGRAAVEEVIAIDVLDGNFKFYSGKFRRWNDWYWSRVEHDEELRAKTSWRHNDDYSEARKAWEKGREAALRELWRAWRKMKPEPKRDYYITLMENGEEFYASQVTSRRIFYRNARAKTIFHARRSDLERRLKGFDEPWEIKEVQGV
jgi:PAS domain-containing protein